MSLKTAAAAAGIVWLGLAVSPTAAASNELYVSTSGDDANDGTSPAAPLRHIAAAMKKAVPGVAILIRAGTYPEQVVTETAGAPGQEIVLKSDQGTAVIDGSSQDWDSGKEQNQGLVELRHPYVRLAGLKVINSKNTGILLNADHLTIENCEVGMSQRHAISTHTDRQPNYQEKGPRPGWPIIRDITIKNCDIHHAPLAGHGFGQAVSLIADGFLVSGNKVHDNVTEGIDIWLGAANGEVVDNEVYDNQRCGIFVDGASHVRIHRNRVFNGRRDGIGVSSENPYYKTHHIWIYDNLIYDNALVGIFVWDDKKNPAYKGSQDLLIVHNTLINNQKLSFYLAGEDNSGRIVNNLIFPAENVFYSDAVNSDFDIRNNVQLKTLDGFASPGSKDFRLRRGSPAIDAGEKIPDLAGSNRVIHGKPDAGCCEYEN